MPGRTIHLGICSNMNCCGDASWQVAWVAACPGVSLEACVHFTGEQEAWLVQAELHGVVGWSPSSEGPEGLLFGGRKDRQELGKARQSPGLRRAEAILQISKVRFWPPGFPSPTLVVWKQVAACAPCPSVVAEGRCNPEAGQPPGAVGDSPGWAGFSILTRGGSGGAGGG